MNANGEKMIEMCGECEMVVGNTFFKKRMIHKITWVSRIEGDKALMDYVLISSKDKERLLDVNVLREVHGGMSDHFLVEGKLKVRYKWEKRRDGSSGREMIKLSEFAKGEKVPEFQGKLEEKWEGVKGSGWRGVEEESVSFKETVCKSAVEVCGMKRVG